MNSKLHAVTDSKARPVLLLLTEGQMNDHKGAELLLDKIPKAETLLGDKGYDSDSFRTALKNKGITPCIPPRKNRKIQHHYCKEMYKKRHKVENMFGKLKDWRRISMRYDRCAHTFFSAILIACIVIWWI